MTQRLLVISDLHLTPPGDFDAFRAGHLLADFVRAHVHADTSLVLAGDVFDLLQLPERPASLDMAAAPALVRSALDGIRSTDWGRDLFLHLRALLLAGGRCIVIPGNHDPELHHPETRALFLHALDLPDSSGFSMHHAHAPWSTQVGRWSVLVGHGHRSDFMNDVPPDALQQALEGDHEPVPLPTGSRLVVDVLRPFKRNARTGSTRFRFIDLLKPEPAVALLLLYLDAPRAVSVLQPALGLGVDSLLRAFRRQLVPRAALSSSSSASTSSAPAPSLADTLASAIAAELDEDLRLAPDAAVRQLQTWLGGHAAPASGTLAPHGGARRWLARAALRMISEDGSFFDKAGLNGTDRAVIREYLPEGCGPRVVICGHTHAAREHHFDGERVYLNTGTWIDLMKPPPLGSDEAAQSWIDALETARFPSFRRPTYAEVTAEGAFLREWPSAAS